MDSPHKQIKGIIEFNFFHFAEKENFTEGEAENPLAGIEVPLKSSNKPGNI